MAAASDEAYGQAAEVVRERDRDRYVADLFVPEALRRHLFAIHAFSAEVARVREVVSDPTLGEIRLQWWRDAIVEGSGGGHPVADALVATIRTFSLPVEAFTRLIDARVFDLYNDPMPTLNDLEGYAGETSSSLFQLAALVFAGGADPGCSDAAGHAGVAYALAGLMRALPLHAARQQCYLPAAMMESRGVDLDTVYSGKATPELKALLVDLRTIARQHLAQAERHLLLIDSTTVRPAFLPLALVKPWLDRMDRPNADPFAGVELSPWRRQWILWRAARGM